MTDLVPSLESDPSSLTQTKALSLVLKREAYPLFICFLLSRNTGKKEGRKERELDKKKEGKKERGMV